MRLVDESSDTNVSLGRDDSGNLVVRIKTGKRLDGRHKRPVVRVELNGVCVHAPTDSPEFDESDDYRWVLTTAEWEEAAKALGRSTDDLPEYEVVEALSLYGHLSADELQRQLSDVRKQFRTAGGMGVGLAERLDQTRMVMAVNASRSAAALPAPEKVSPRTVPRSTSGRPSGSPL